MSNGKELQKNIGFFSACAIVMGTVIGSGVFFNISNVTEVTGTAGMALFVWFLGGIISICAGLTAEELEATTPDTGGLTKNIVYTYGDFWAFLSGWSQSFIFFLANV
ncbi:amino acid permease, partial [Staphylococcus aureus]|uniref:amino acid permease n=1 Tax=Staphylococcus aureus TaxID=1280 RepID=UPI00114D1F7A